MNQICMRCKVFLKTGSVIGDCDTVLSESELFRSFAANISRTGEYYDHSSK